LFDVTGSITSTPTVTMPILVVVSIGNAGTVQVREEFPSVAG